MPGNDTKQPEHLLIIRLSALGDVAMTVPLVLALRQQYPELKLTVVSRPFYGSFFSEIPDVNFYPVNFDDAKKGIFYLYQLYRKLSHLQIDAFADLHNVLRTKVIRTFFSMSGVRTAYLDKGRSERKKLTTLGPKVISPIKPIIERQVEVCKKLGLNVSIRKVKLLPKKSLSKDTLSISGPKKQQWIGIAPFATYETKMYPMELMAASIDLLLKENYRIFLFGAGKKEIASLEKLAGVSDRVINMAGAISFEKELELISNLDLMLSMDSGNGHIAALFGIPVITMWGNTHPFAGFTPFGQPLENSLLPDIKKYPLLPTSVYGNKFIKGYEDCMKSIAPDAVLSKVKAVLSK